MEVNSFTQLLTRKFLINAVNGVMWGIYAFTFVLFGLNIALSYMPNQVGSQFKIPKESLMKKIMPIYEM